MTEPIRLASPQLGEAELGLVAEVLASGNLTMGPMLARFEEATTPFTGTRHALACANGTAALHLALLALGVGPGDEVIVPAYTFPATANACYLVGATPVFCDVVEGLDVTSAELIEPHVTERTRAIMVVHLFGYPVEMAPIEALAARHGLPIVEDAAGALGASIQGRAAGSIGALGCFSFHPRKIVTTGEGGIVSTDDDALAASVRALRHHGIGPEGFVEVGLNYRLSDVLAALAIPQLERLETTLAAHQRLAERYFDGLSAIDGIDPAPMPRHEGDQHGWQAYVARVQGGAEARDAVVASLRAVGVECNIGTYCVPGIAPYLKRGFDPAAMPSSVASFEAGLALPLYPTLGEDGVDRVLEAVAAATRSVSYSTVG